jgi:hypothetical protein
MALQKLVSGILMCTVLLFVCGNSFARCAPSVAYQTSFEIVACDDRDPSNRSRTLGYGAILEVKVLSRKRMENTGQYDWWPVNDPLPKKMKVFYDKQNAKCSSLKPGAKRQGTMRSLCCDGAEPRCNSGTAVALYDR